MESSSALLQVQDLEKAYRGTHALAGVSFAVGQGAIHALVGGNGSGKSTLIKILAGVVAADAGRLAVGPAAIDARDQTPARAREMGLHFVHQQDSTFGSMTVAENLAIGRGFETGRVSRILWRQQRKRAIELLDRFEIDARPEDEVSRLSAATKAMVAIARALQDQQGEHGGVLVLDEPTASLPAHEVELLLSALQRYAAAGQTILFVSHRLPEVLSVCNGATVLRDGRVAADLAGEDLNHDNLVSLIAGQPLAALDHRAVDGIRASATAPVVLRTSGVAGGDGELVVRRGEVVGVAGLLGSGRSALLRNLFGLSGHSAASFQLDGNAVEMETPYQAMSAGIAYVPEDRLADAAFVELSVQENMLIASVGDAPALSWVNRRQLRETAEELRSACTVKTPSLAAPLAALSGGNQQKVIIARWLNRGPRLLLLDEPTQGVDIGARSEIHRLVRQAASEGCAVVVVSSEFEELASLCDRAVILADGQIVDEVDDTRMSDEELLAAVYAQRSAS